MEIVTLEFEEKLIVIKDNQRIQVTAFLTDDPGIIKMGIDAPRGIGIDREEIYKLKKEKLNQQIS